MALIDERVDRLDVSLARFMDQSSLILAVIREEVAEIRASNARTDRQLLQIQQGRREFQERYETDRKQSEKRHEKARKLSEERSEEDRKQSEERHERDRKLSEERYEKDRRDFNKRMAEISEAWAL